MIQLQVYYLNDILGMAHMIYRFCQFWISKHFERICFYCSAYARVILIIENILRACHIVMYFQVLFIDGGVQSVSYFQKTMRKYFCGTEINTLMYLAKSPTAILKSQDIWISNEWHLLITNSWWLLLPPSFGYLNFELRIFLEFANYFKNLELNFEL